MQQAISYLLGVHSADAQADLVRAQILLAGQELINSGVQKAILDAQLVQINAQTAITVEGLQTALEDTKIKKQQVINLGSENLGTLAETSVKAQQLVNLVTANTQSITQTDNIAEDTSMKIQQKLNLVEEVLKTRQDTANAVSTNAVILNQATKVLSEVALLDQKKASEVAQTENTADPDSVIGKKSALYQKQTDGFDRDAEQKLTKMLLDTWSIRQSTDGATASTAGIQDSAIRDVIGTAKAGISVLSSNYVSDIGVTDITATFATVSFLTTEPTGSAYYMISTNPVESVGNIVNNASADVVSGVGLEIKTITGLTAETKYYAHVVQRRNTAEYSDVLSSLSFITLAA
jgi:hypothetical protein